MSTTAGVLGAISRHRLLTGLSATYFAGFTIYGAASASANTVIYAAVVATLFVIVALADDRVRFSGLVLFGLAVWGFAHMAGGLIASGDDVLYGRFLLPFLRFDQVVHAWGFGFAGLATWEVVRRHVAPDAQISGALIVFIGGMAFGALNEMIEFLLTRVWEDTNVGGFENTGWDLVANTVGSTIAAIWTRFGRR